MREPRVPDPARALRSGRGSSARTCTGRAGEKCARGLGALAGPHYWSRLFRLRPPEGAGSRDRGAAGRCLPSRDLRRSSCVPQLLSGGGDASSWDWLGLGGGAGQRGPRQPRLWMPGSGTQLRGQTQHRGLRVWRGSRGCRRGRDKRCLSAALSLGIHEVA